MRRSIHFMPELSLDEYRDLTSQMKVEWLFVQQTKIGEDINGRNYDHTQSHRVPKAMQKQSLQDGSERRHPQLQDREVSKAKKN